MTSNSVFPYVLSTLELFMAGVFDSVSVYRTFPLMSTCIPAFKTTASILGANIFLLLGSLLIYEKGISPGIGFMRGTFLPPSSLLFDDNNNKNIDKNDDSALLLVDHLFSMIYHAIWVLPVYILCYTCSTAWYQDLADQVYRHVKGVPPPSATLQKVGYGLYSTLVWLCLFVQVQLLVNVTPLLANEIVSWFVWLLALPPWAWEQQSFSSSSFSTTMLHIIQFLCTSPVLSISYVAQGVGYVLMSTLYGWYGFDPHWIAAGIDPDQRFTMIEKRWVYFLGFGFPYVVLVKSTGFFLGYGCFLALFPFCIMLGALSDFDAPYALDDVKPSRHHTKGRHRRDHGARQQLPPLRVFRTAISWALSILKIVDRNAHAKRAPAKRE